jgi:hypothetical protein
MSSIWGPLDDKEELELHKQRLLNIEEKPFKRVTKRLSTLYALASSRARQAPTPPLENNGTNGASATGVAADEARSPTEANDPTAAEIEQLKEDVTLDFAAFTSNIERLQLLLTANEKQRERYAAERVRILETSQTVRDKNTELRGQLDEARAMLEQRRKFDELADKITRNPSLRSRNEQVVNLAKLEEEIAALQVESEAYTETWRERRDQFSKIMDESMRLRRQIRDEKEEVERREGMDDDNEGPGPSGPASGNATPRPESGAISKGGPENSDTAGTPHLARDSPGPETHATLKPLPGHLGAPSPGASRAGSRPGSRAVSREVTPVIQEDVDMADTKEHTDGLAETPTAAEEVAETGASAEDAVAMGEDEDMTEVAGVQASGEAPEEMDSPLTPVPPDDPPRIIVEGDGEGDQMDTT